MGGTQHHIGDAESRVIVNLTVDILLDIQQSALAEILGMAKRDYITLSATASRIIGMPACNSLKKIAADPAAARKVALFSLST